MSEQPVSVTEAEAEAQAAVFLAEQNLEGEVDLASEGDQASVIVG